MDSFGKFRGEAEVYRVALPAYPETSASRPLRHPPIIPDHHLRGTDGADIEEVQAVE
ncbi:MAG: hypothetical protein NVS4B3_27540 [Gemmatimonadaceae bacterium]